MKLEILSILTKLIHQKNLLRKVIHRGIIIPLMPEAVVIVKFERISSSIISINRQKNPVVRDFKNALLSNRDTNIVLAAIKKSDFARKRRSMARRLSCRNFWTIKYF